MPESTITHTLPYWDKYYTIEFKGFKGWEIHSSYDPAYGLHKVIEIFQRIVINDSENLQWRLTTNQP
jgi:hypothetical protein